MTTFEVGNQRYDTKLLGYATTSSAATRKLDTTEVGNSSSGHDYGTALFDAERMALIEYLKTL